MRKETVLNIILLGIIFVGCRAVSPNHPAKSVAVEILKVEDLIKDGAAGIDRNQMVAIMKHEGLKDWNKNWLPFAQEKLVYKIYTYGIKVDGQSVELGKNEVFLGKKFISGRYIPEVKITNEAKEKQPKALGR